MRESVGATGGCAIEPGAVDGGHDGCGLVADVLWEAIVLVGPAHTTVSARSDVGHGW